MVIEEIVQVGRIEEFNLKSISGKKFSIYSSVCVSWYTLSLCAPVERIV